MSHQRKLEEETCQPRFIGTDDETYARWNRKLNRSWASADYAKIGVTRYRSSAKPWPRRSGFAHRQCHGSGRCRRERQCLIGTCPSVLPCHVDRFCRGYAGTKGSLGRSAEDLTIDFEIADAQDLHYADNSLSKASFLPSVSCLRQTRKSQRAKELIRVCRSGGKIALACWTPQGFTGRVCATIGRHMGAGSGFKSPTELGPRGMAARAFRSALAAKSRSRGSTTTFRYRSPEHYLDFLPHELRTDAQGVPGRGPRKGEHALGQRHPGYRASVQYCNRTGSLCAPSEYAEVVMTKDMTRPTTTNQPRRRL